MFARILSMSLQPDAHIVLPCMYLVYTLYIPCITWHGQRQPEITQRQESHITNLEHQDLVVCLYIAPVNGVLDSSIASAAIGWARV